MYYFSCLFFCFCFCFLDMRKTTVTQDCIPVGCIPPAGWPYLPVCSAPGGCLPGLGGAFLVRGGGIPACTEADPPPCEQNHRRLWKYYLAPTSLRAVIMFIFKLDQIIDCAQQCRIPLQSYCFKSESRTGIKACHGSFINSYYRWLPILL